MTSTMTPTNAVIANLAVNPAFAKSIKYEPTTNTSKPVRDRSMSASKAHKETSLQRLCEPELAPDGGPPNNWISNFGGSAWTWDEATGQYYYHAYLAEQPDLNWRNPNVRAAMHEALRFWLRRGVDGFRVDVMWHLIKDAAFRDNPPNPAWPGA